MCTVVHNGIVENHAELKSELMANGVVFASETDTEVIAQLMNLALRTASTLDEAFSKTLAKLVGSFAIAVIVDGYEDVLLVARNGSPLAIGYGDPDQTGSSEMFVGSDALALAPFTENVSYLEDGDWAVITPGARRLCVTTQGLKLCVKYNTCPLKITALIRVHTNTLC